jgi:hypothetical protein
MTKRGWKTLAWTIAAVVIIAVVDVLLYAGGGYAWTITAHIRSMPGIVFACLGLLAAWLFIFTPAPLDQVKAGWPRVWAGLTLLAGVVLGHLGWS